MTRSGSVDAFDSDENEFHTDPGRGVCHWCSFRPPAWVWGPYETRVCDYCQELIEGGHQGEIIEEAAARLPVRDNWVLVADPERWRLREHALMARWLEVRPDCQAIDLW